MSTLPQVRSERKSLPGGQVQSKGYAALQLAARGFNIFPAHSIINGHCTCNPHGPCKRGKPGKHPRIKGWQTLATTDPAQIKAWWTQWPSANIGIATGKGLRFFVLDDDPRHNGNITLAELESKHGALPDTLTVVSGSGGRHFYFLLPEDVTLNNRVGDTWGLQGLDIKTVGGLVH